MHKPNAKKNGLDVSSKQTVVIPGEKGEKVFLMLSRDSERVGCCRGAGIATFRNEAPAKLPGGSRSGKGAACFLFQSRYDSEKDKKGG